MNGNCLRFPDYLRFKFYTPSFSTKFRSIEVCKFQMLVIIIALECLIIFCMLISPQSAYSAKRALIIGINHYLYHNEFVAKKRMALDLDGARDDAKDMAEVLINKMGFSRAEIRLLLDDQATLLNIEQGIAGWLKTETKPGDTVLFYFSGHGFLMNHPNGDKTLLCPHNANPFNLDNLISTDRLSELFLHLQGRTLLAIIDACHSATAIRGIEGIPGLAEGSVALKRARQFPAEQIYASSGKTRDLHIFDQVHMDKVFLAACGSQEKAWEMPIEGRTRGVFTYSLLRALSQNNGAVTPEMLVKETSRYISGHNLPQHPEIKTGTMLARLKIRDLFFEDSIVHLAELHDPSPSFTITLQTPDPGKHMYRIGESFAVSVSSERNGYLYLLNINTNKEVSLLFPNKWDKSNVIEADHVLIVPGRNAMAEFIVSEPTGTETVLALVSTEPWPEMDLIRGNAEELITSLNDQEIHKAVGEILSRNGLRSIKVRPKNNEQIANLASKNSDWALASIKIDVVP